MPKKVLLKTRQKTKIRNTFASNMFMDINLSKAQFPKIIHSGGFLGKYLNNLDKKVLLDLAA